MLLALLVLFALFILIALPGLLALSRPKAAVVAAPLYIALLAGIFLHYSGLSFGGRLPAAARSAPGAAAGSGLCGQAISQARDIGLIVDHSSPTRVTVNRDLWGQLPQQAKDGIVLCLERARPARLTGDPVEIVEIGPR